MTETLLDPPPVPPPPPGPRLARDPREKVVAGVCAAFGRYTSTDPVLWRVAVAVLAVFGGAGLVLYALGWLLLPRVDQAESPVERLLRRPDRGLSVVGIVLVAVAAIAVLGLLDDGPGLGVVLVLGGLAYLVVRERRESPPSPAGSTAPTPSATTAFPTSYGPTTWSDGGTAPAPVPRRPRERSPLGVLTVSAAAVLTGVLLTLRAAGVDGITGPRVLAAGLVVVGAGLVVGTWIGRARWLMAVGLVLAVALAGSVIAREAGVDAGLGERTWTATGNDSYRLGVGSAELDLRQLRPGQRADIRARVGLGELVVLVPAGTSVEVTADVGVGDIRERDLAGRLSDPSEPGGDDTDVHAEFTVGDPADARVQLDLEVGMGEVEVRRVAA